MSNEIVEAADRSCKYSKGIECHNRKCGNCGFDPAVQRKRIRKMRAAWVDDGERLIDANALRDKQFGSMRWLSGYDLDAAPTIDAVRVIRCKDCALCVKKSMFGRLQIYECRKTCFAVNPDDYCSKAKRRTGNDD